ncbi:hypothetical protein LSTR_LSTR016096 [Laodelphax striatellus]|uniref:Uncharacterized protein n=1 Tax=Laodelphax striatellus TaxID=195883 RepID=A0A482WVY4_LAOST|nr:hypothetical protein LSTR_LSTR003074 [Laodelphax striatellus]RZF45833.1 hypothetical protein LSTR_LSTR016096 [Laodelphax striatellus]
MEQPAHYTKELRKYMMHDRYVSRAVPHLKKETHIGTIIPPPTTTIHGLANWKICEEKRTASKEGWNEGEDARGKERE